MTRSDAHCGHREEISERWYGGNTLILVLVQPVICRLCRDRFAFAEISKGLSVTRLVLAISLAGSTSAS
jgi:hypothetical protein